MARKPMTIDVFGNKLTLKAIKELMPKLNESQTGVDDYFGDGQAGALIIEGLLRELERLDPTCTA